MPGSIIKDVLKRSNTYHKIHQFCMTQRLVGTARMRRMTTAVQMNRLAHIAYIAYFTDRQFWNIACIAYFTNWLRIISNYWMRLSMISWIIKTEVWVICRSRRLRQITQTWGFDDSWYHAKTEFNNCFIIHFSHNSSSETEAKHSALTSGRRHSKLNKRTPLNKPIVFIVFRILLSFWPGLLSSIVVLQLCLLHEVRAKHSAILFLRRTLQGA